MAAGRGDLERLIRVNLLFVTSRFPYPPTTGDRLRALQQLKWLSRRHRVTLVSLAKGTPTPTAMAALKPYCAELKLVPFRWREGLGHLARRLFSAIPLQVALFESRELRATLDALLDGGHYDLLHMQLARSTLNVPAQVTLPRVLDLIDALSVNMAGRYRHDRGPARWLAGLEAGRLRRYESRLCQQWDRLTLVSAQDREAIGPRANLCLNPNGVDPEDFPYVADGRARDEILFTGNLGYFANVEAVVWFHREVLPLIRARRPGVKWRLVGARPHRSLLSLARNDPDIEVRADVERMHPYLARASVAVAPIRTGSGQSLKVLEAMAAGAPLVATPFAVRELAVEPGRHLLLAGEPGAFADQVLSLLEDPLRAQTLAASARTLVESQYTWRQAVEQLERIYQDLLPCHRSEPCGGHRP